MTYEAIIYNQQGMAKSDVRAILTRAWLLNGYEQCSLTIATSAYADQLDDFGFGNYLVVTDDELPIWGGYFDPNQTWGSDGSVTINAYSGEKIFGQRCYPGSKLLRGTAGAIYREIIMALNNAAPAPTLLQPGVIFDGGDSREETIAGKQLYDDVNRIATRSGYDWYVEPVVENGRLHFEGHWYARRGTTRLLAIEEGVNIEASSNVLEYQGDIWNYIFAYGEGATWADRVTTIVSDSDSINQYGLRMYGLAVNAKEQATVQASAAAFLAQNQQPRRVFNLTAGPGVLEANKSTLFKTLRIGDVAPLTLYTVGKGGVDTKVRLMGMTHDGERNALKLILKEINL